MKRITASTNITMMLRLVVSPEQAVWLPSGVSAIA